MYPTTGMHDISSFGTISGIVGHIGHIQEPGSLGDMSSFYLFWHLRWDMNLRDNFTDGCIQRIFGHIGHLPATFFPQEI